MKSSLRALVVPVGLISVSGTLLPVGVTAQGQPGPVTARPSGPPPEDEIISDDVFNRALPPLDGPAQAPAPDPTTASRAVTAPEARKPQTGTPPEIASPEVAAQTPETPETAPVLAPILADDPELATPLGELTRFNEAPLYSGSAVPSEAQAQIEYDVELSGLDDLATIERSFNDLSTLKAGKGKAANATMIRVRANTDEELMLRLLNSEGYFDARARVSLRPQPDRAGRLRALMRVTPGKPYYVGTIAFGVPSPPPSAELDALMHRELKMGTGDPIDAGHILGAEAGLGEALPRNGYPFARIGARDIALDPATQRGDYTLNVDPGPKSVFGDIETATDTPFKVRHIRELARFQRGQMYDSRLTADLNQALSATGLYRSVNAEPILSKETTADGSTIVNIRVNQDPGKPRTLAAEVGYNTGEGYHASTSWTYRNLYPPEGALILTALAGDLTQGLSATFRRTNAGQRDRTLQFGTSFTHNRLDTYESYASGLTATLTRLSTPIWQKQWTWSVGMEALVTREQAFSTARNLVEWQTYVLLNLPMKLTLDRSDNLLDPNRGYRIGGQLSPQASFKDTASSNAKMILDASLYHPLNRRITLAARTRLGWLAGGGLDSIAPSQRLYAGGGGSVRGFAYQALGPIDATGAPTGGRSLTEASIELRYRVGDVGLVPFIDAGQVYETSSPRISKLRFGVGVGARYYTGFGPLRIDLATPLSRRSGEASVAIYVGIGQTF